jgi:hypothetical protein
VSDATLDEQRHLYALVKKSAADIDCEFKLLDDALQLLAETRPGRRERLRLALLGNSELMDRLLKTTAGNDPFGTNRERGTYCGLAIDAFVDGLLAAWRRRRKTRAQ